MEIAARALSPVLHKLGELLKDEYNLKKRVRKGVRSLLLELELMHAALRKVGEMPSDQLDEPVRIWSGKVRDLSYDMEDAVDAFMLSVDDGGSSSEPNNMKKKFKKFFKKTTKLVSNGKTLHQISDAIKEAQDLAKELAELRKRYELNMCSNSSGATIDTRVIALHKNVGELVGINHTSGELITKLINEDGSPREQLKTISIVGVGGLGKTTLTKVIYDNIKGQFNCAAFVLVGQNPDIRKNFKDILYGLDQHKFRDIHITTRDENLLIQEIREFLVDKRYLIVIDDIWEEQTWEFINCALHRNELHSWVITTTRNMSVSQACPSSNDGMIHEMKPLSDEDSQILFHRRIFQSEEKCPEELQDVSGDIFKKCGGVPLAIITIASLLVSNQQIKPKYEWLHLFNSIGRGITKGAILEDMKRILSLSYNHLPSHLKTCLLYLSIFPEDHAIERDWLILRWLAEGFIQGDKEENGLFEIGESYFNELLNRSLIQPARINDEGMVESCRIHDMVLEIICSLSSEENFVSILDNGEWLVPNLQREVRRLSLHNAKAKYHNHQFDSTSLSKVRSFVVFPAATCDWTLPSLSSFQFLRVLDLGYSGGHGSASYVSLKYVGNLLHLRYLGLRGANADKLPADIGKLQLLQTMDIRGTGITELPASVVELRHLICLCVDRGTRLPKGIGNLKSLQVLEVVTLHLSPRIVKVLSHLTNVRTLTIECSQTDEDLMNVLIESLGNLHKLQYLKIRNCGRLINLMREGWMPPPVFRRFESIIYSGETRYEFLRLPKWINSTLLPLLSTLVIGVEELQADDIQIIGMLPALCFLCLEAPRVMGRFVARAGAFRSARVCRFVGFPTPPCLFQPGSMPRLQVLWFEVSARLIASGVVDCGMRHLPSLENIHVRFHDENSSAEEQDAAKDVLRGAAEAHPKRPTIYFTWRYNDTPTSAAAIGTINDAAHPIKSTAVIGTINDAAPEEHSNMQPRLPAAATAAYGANLQLPVTMV